MELLIRRLIDYEPIAKADRFLTYADRLTWQWDPAAPDLDSISVSAFGLTRAQAEHLVRTSREYVYFDNDEDDLELGGGNLAANDDLYTDNRWETVQAIQDALPTEKVALFRSIGWDVHNHKGQPAVILAHIDIQLALGALSLVGGIPEVQPRLSGVWATSLEQEAEKFLRSKGR